MAEGTKIEWTTHTANFWWGCVKTSTGCQNCYALSWANRWGKQIWGPPSTTQREYKKAAWSDVPKWNKSAGEKGIRERVFVSSMSDFFEDHPQVAEWRAEALALMLESTNLDFQILTKRTENIMRMVEESGEWLLSQSRYKPAKQLLLWVKHGREYAPKNFWMGTSVENQEQAEKRIPHLIKVPAVVRFLSCEPLLGPIDFDVDSHLSVACAGIAGTLYPIDLIDWVIVGAESGHGARPMDLDWVRSMRDQCVTADVPFFFKQMIIDGKKVSLPELDGKAWAQMPGSGVTV